MAAGIFSVRKCQIFGWNYLQKMRRQIFNFEHAQSLPSEISICSIWRKIATSCSACCSKLYPVYTIKLSRRAGCMLAGRASPLFVRRLLDVCSMFVRSCKRDIRLNSRRRPTCFGASEVKKYVLQVTQNTQKVFFLRKK